MKKSTFDEHHVLHELKHYLPTQTPLKDFIHHNSLHAFQSSKFYDAIFKSSKVFGHQATMPLSDFRKLFNIGRIRPEILDRAIENREGSVTIDLWKNNLISKYYNDHNEQRIGKLRSQWKQNYHIDLDNLVQPFLFRFLCSYLDQGIAIWDFPIGNKGFLESIKELEKNSFTSIFK
uniref:putative inorganic carbon transporter subunit DabA n=1 Tax=Flavobacterium sp. TaxID=239 RepID=UPI00374CB311